MWCTFPPERCAFAAGVLASRAPALGLPPCRICARRGPRATIFYLKLALKIDVATLRGTRDAVPRLLEILERHQAGATFLFSLGPDRSGWRGKLPPAPQLGRCCEDVMRKVRDAGFEVGVHAWDAAWWKSADASDDHRTGWQMQLAVQRFQEVFGEAPQVHGAPGWHMNVHAFRRTQSMGFLYSSDTLGTHPYIPVVRAEIVACPQLPTTLPTLDQRPPEKILERTAAEQEDHVFTLHADRPIRAFEPVLAGWKGQGYELVPLRTLAASLNLASLPLHTVSLGARATQGPGFLEEKSPP
jgi:undecaprenyl phosphate-alpha-L-ara4FN deformylase